MDFLNYHHLRYFWVAAREGGLTRASKKLHVSQSSLCTQIQALENVLGEKLLRRSGQGLALTDAGQRVAPNTTRSTRSPHTGSGADHPRTW